MTDNRNTILAVILSGLVLIAWQYFYNVPQMERQRAQTQAQTELAKSSTPQTPGLGDTGLDHARNPAHATTHAGPAGPRPRPSSAATPRSLPRPASRSRRRGCPAASR